MWKYKDNCNQEKYNNSWKQINESKCNIRKESKMIARNSTPPIITHTAPTPQDSPNTNLDTYYRDFYTQEAYPKKLSFESDERLTVSRKAVLQKLIVYSIF